MNVNLLKNSEAYATNSGCAEYNEIGDFYGGLARVGKHLSDYMMKYGFIDKQGNLIIPLKYDVAYDFLGEVAPVGIRMNEDVKYGFINKLGDEVIPITYDYASYLSKTLCVTNNHRGWNVFTTEGNLISTYDEIYRTSNQDLIKVKINGKYGLISSKDGYKLTEIKYDEVRDITNNSVSARVNNKWHNLRCKNIIKKNIHYLWTD